MRFSLLVLVLFLFGCNIGLRAQQSLFYEMKLTRVYSAYPLNQDQYKGPDISYQVRAQLLGLGGAPIAGSADVYLRDLTQVGWIDIPDQVVVSGTYTAAAGIPQMNLCGSGVGVRFDALRAWEEDGNSPGTFNSGTDDDYLNLNSGNNITGAPELSGTSGNTRTFELRFPFANGYYGFEFSVSYTLTNGIREVIYTGDVNGGPVADACGGGQVYIHPRTGPGFTGGYFQYEQSNNGGASWSPLGPPTSSTYKSVIVTDDPNQKFRVRLLGENLCLGGDAPKEPINVSDLDIFSSINQEDIDLSFTRTCEGTNEGSVTINSVGPIPASTNIRLQLERFSSTGIQIVDAPTVQVSEFPFTFNNVGAGVYRVNVTVVTNNGSTQTLANCTTRSNLFVVNPFYPRPLLGVAPFNPSCGENAGSVRVFSFAIPQVYQLLDAAGNLLQSSPSTSAGFFDFNNLAAGNYRIRSLQSGCLTEELTFTIAGTPPPAGGTVEVIQQAAPFDVACQFKRTIANFRATPGSGTNDVIVYTVNLGTPSNVPMAVGEVSEGGVYSTSVFAWDYRVEFIRRDNGCSTTIDFSVSEDPNQIQVPDCNFGDCPTSVAPTACTPNSGQSTFPIRGGILPYSISIDGVAAPPTSTTPITNGTEFFYNNLTSGNHFVRVTDNRGCTRDFDFFVPRAPNFTVNLTNTNFNLDCNGDTDGRVQLTVPSFAAGTPPYLYKIPEINDVFVDNNFFENIPPGEYTAVARDADGCEAIRAFEVTEPAPLVVDEVFVVPPVCSGDEHQVFVLASGPILCDDYSDPEGGPIFAPTLRFYYEYSTDGGTTWNEPDGNTSVALDRSNCSANQRINFPLPSGNYTIQLRRRNVVSCLSNSVSITPADFVDISPLALSLGQAVNPACAGESDGYISVDFSGGSNGYELELVRFSSVNPPSGATVVETVDFIELAGRYTFTGLSATAANEGYAVRLRNKLSDGTLPDENCAAYLPGNYVAGNNFTPITLSAPLALQGGSVVTAQPLDCTGAGATLTISGVTGGTPPYEYSVNGSDFSTATTQGGAEENEIIVRDASGCTINLQHSITEVAEPPLMMSFSSLPPLGCDPSIRGQLMVDFGEGPFTYAYAPTADGAGEPQNPTIVNTELATLPLEDLTAGTLFVRLTTLDGCSNLFSYPIADPGYQPLTASTTQIIPETCENDGDGSITIQAAGGVAPYEIVFAGVITTEVTRTVTDLSSGRYVFGVRDAAGCTIIHEVGLNPSSEGFPITIGGDPATPCADAENGSIVLTPTGGVAPFTLAWSDGAPGATISSIGGSATRSNLSRAEYPLTITDGNGCTVIRSPLPGGRDPLEAEIIDVAQPDCGGAATGGFTVSITRNSFPSSNNFLVSINGAAPVDQLIFTNLAGGDYVVDVIDDSGCGLLTPLMVTLEGQSQINVMASDITDVTCGGEATGSVTLSATGGNGPFTYALGTGTFQASPTFTGLIAGTYDFRVQDADGCIAPLNGISVADGATISGTLALTSPDCNGELGSLEVSPTSGTPPYNYSLNSGPTQTEPIFQNLTASLEYSVLITDANGCSFTTPAELLTEPDPVTATATPSGVGCFGDTDGSISIAGTGGAAPLEYRLNGGDYGNEASFTDLAAGDYSIQVRDANGCESPVATVTVAAPPAITASITETTPESCGQTDGTATATANGGTGTLTLNWPGGQTGATATGLSAGSYQLTITDQNSCEQLFDFTILSAGGPNLTLVSAQDANCGAADGSIEVSNSEGTAPFTYNWSHDASLNAPLATGLGAGDYSVTITDANTCTSQLMVSISESAPPSLAIETVSPSLCTDGNGAASVMATGGTPPYAYVWSHDANQNTASLTDLVAGDYTVSVTDANACTASVDLTIALVAGPTAVTGNTTPISCADVADGSITIVATGGTLPLQYRLNGGDYGDEASFTGLAAGNYSIQARDANGCESPIETISLTAPPAIMAQVTNTTAENCNQADGTATATASGGTPPLTLSWPGGQSGTTASNFTAGDYQLTVTDANNCTLTMPFNIPAAGGPSLSLVNVTDASCEAANGSIEVSTTEGTPPYTYTWSHNAGLNAAIANNLAVGDYTVTVTDANNCTNTLSTSVGETPKPVLSVASVTSSLCTNDNGSATVSVTSGTGPFTYSWSHDNTLDAPTADNLPAGDYTISVTDANACTDEVMLTVGFIPGPSNIALLNLIPTTCGLDNGSITIDGSGGTPPYRFEWADFPALIDGTADNLPAGDYSVTVFDANNCSITQNFTVEASTPATLVLVASADAGCNVANGSIEVSTQNTTGLLVYTWSHDANLNAPLAENLPAGAYTVMVTDANNCTAELSVNISNTEAPTLSLSESTDAICVDGTGSATIGVTGGVPPYAYSWSHATNLDSPTAPDLNAGGYSVTVTDANGCAEVLSLTIGFIPGLQGIDLLDLQATTCGLDNGRIEVGGIGGTPPYRYEWLELPGLTDKLADNLPAGNYTVTIFDANDCSITELYTVAPSDVPAVSLSSQTDASCGEANGRIEISTSDFTGLLVYEWSHDANLNEPVAENLAAGTYTVLVRDALDCSATLTISISNLSAPGLELVATNNSICTEGNGSIEVSNSGGGQAPFVYTWSHTNNLNAPLAENLASGDYGVTITDALGCQSVVNTTVELEAAPAIIGFDLAPALCAQNNGSATVNFTGGTPPLIYTWSHDLDLNAPTATNLPPGETSLTITDRNGCFDSQNFTIESEAGPANLVAEEVIPTSCGLANGRLQLAVTDGVAPLVFNWSHDQDIAANTAENLPSGTYSVTVTDANGCFLTESFEVGASQALAITADSLANTNCGEANGYLRVAVANATGLLVYDWQHDPQLEGPIAENLLAGAYSVTITDALSCTQEQQFIIENLNVAAVATAEASPALCENGTGSILVSVTDGQPPFTYEWSHDAGLDGPFAENLTAGIYAISVTGQSGCTSIVQGTVGFTPAPEVTPNVTPLDCASASSGAISVDVTGGAEPFTYSWSTGASTPDLSGLDAGTYTLTLTDANNCMSVVEAAVAPVNLANLAVASVTPGDCLPEGGSAVLITNLAQEDFTVNWPGPSAAVSLVALPEGGTQITLSPLAAGTYPVSIVQSGGCSVVEDVVIPDTLAWSITSSNTSTSCFNTEDGSLAVIVTGAGDFTYNWSPEAGGQTTPTIMNLGPGSYDVTVSDAAGCARTLAAEVMASDTVAITLVSQTDPSCEGAANGAISVTGQGGTGALSYRWSPAGLANAPDLVDLVSGAYSLSLSDANGCLDTLSIVLNEPMASSLPLPADTSICLDDLYLVDLSAYTNPMITGPGGFLSSESISLLATAGTYQIQATNEEDCPLSSELELSVTSQAFVAGMVLPSDVVVGDSVVVLETSWPAPDNVEWVLNRTGAREVRRSENQYWFIFDEVGDYELSLLAGFGGCEDLITKGLTVHADSTSIPSIPLQRSRIESVVIRPNPSNGQFSVDIELSENAEVFVNLYDANGGAVERRQDAGASSYSVDFNLSSPPAGTYVLLVQTAFGRRTGIVLIE